MASLDKSGILPPPTKAKSLLEEASGALGKGEAKKAAALLEEAVSIPHHLAQNFYAAGILYIKLGDGQKALPFLEKAVAAKPASAPYQMTLGAQYLGNKKIHEAIEAFNRATFLQPGPAKPFLSLALAASAGGNKEIAGSAFKNFFKRAMAAPFFKLIFLLHLLFASGVGLILGLVLPGRPLKGSLNFEKAKAFIAWGKKDAATALLKADWEAGNGFSASCLLLARLYLEAELAPFARTLVLEGMERFPDNPELLLTFNEISRAQGRLAEAFETLEKISKKHQGSAGYQLALAHTLYKNNEAAKALPWFEKGLKEARPNPENYYTFGRCLGGAGEMEGAAEAFKKAIELDPGYGLAYVGLAKMGALDPKGTIFEKLIKTSLKLRLPQKNRCMLNLAAGFALEKDKQYDKAFSYFKTGNDLRDVAYCPEMYEQKTSDLKKVFTPALIKRLTGLGSASEKPIFIVGMPRSGTTLTEQILASHPLVFGAGEREVANILINDFQERFGEFEPVWPQSAREISKMDFKKMASQYLADIERVADKAPRVTDKMPGNFWQLGLLASLFPKARIIHCRRDPVDTCLSNFFQAYHLHHPYSFRLENLGHYYQEYQKIMTHWHKVLPGRILDFDYEKTISNPKNQTQELLKFCDLDWHDDCLNFHKAKTTVQTSSFAQVRQPIYKTSAKKWKLYEKHLGPLLETLK